MKFEDLIKAHSWLSIKITLQQLYNINHDDLIEEYNAVIDTLKQMEAEVDDNMLIVLKEGNSTDYDIDGQPIDINYVAVSGRKITKDVGDDEDTSYGLEFVKWERWLGMSLAPETLNNYNELEIIAHCLNELTTYGFEQEEIQRRDKAISKTLEDYKNMTDEDKNSITKTVDDFLKNLDDYTDNI